MVQVIIEASRRRNISNWICVVRSQSRHLEEVKCWNVAFMMLTIALSFMRVIEGAIVRGASR